MKKMKTYIGMKRNKTMRNKKCLSCGKLKSYNFFRTGDKYCIKCRDISDDLHGKFIPHKQREDETRHEYIERRNWQLQREMSKL